MATIKITTVSEQLFSSHLLYLSFRYLEISRAARSCRATRVASYEESPVQYVQGVTICSSQKLSAAFFSSFNIYPVC